MFFIGLGRAAPTQCYSQKEGWDALLLSPKLSQLTSRSQALVRKVLFGDNGIATRHLALDSLAEAFDLDPDILHERFERHAPSLATLAADRALQQAEQLPAAMDAVIVSTCTGY